MGSGDHTSTLLVETIDERIERLARALCEKHKLNPDTRVIREHSVVKLATIAGVVVFAEPEHTTPMWKVYAELIRELDKFTHG